MRAILAITYFRGDFFNFLAEKTKAKLKRNSNPAFIIVSAFAVLTVLSAIGKNEFNKFKSTNNASAISTAAIDTPPDIDLHYPIEDNNGSVTDQNNNSMDLNDPSNIKQDVQYDPETNQYILTETIGDQFYRSPTYMSFEEFLKYEYDKTQKENFEQLSNSNSLLTHKGLIPKVNVGGQLADRLFGGTSVDIRPNGNIDLTFGYNRQNIQNPTLTAQQRKQGGFQFDMNIQMNVVGKIGDKLKLTTNYNTQSSFDFENQVKLEYTGYQDEIIKKIEAGNVSLPLNTTLIQGSQSLFGLKTQLQFGRLMLTSVISQQKSQAQNITIQGGAQTQTFEVNADQYDENRNYFLGQYFRENYNKNMAQIPIINTGAQINKIEVWVTNKNGATTLTRDIVAFQDLGENQPYSPQILPYTGNNLPAGSSLNKFPTQSASNDLYYKLSQDQNARSLSSTIQTLTGGSYQLQAVQDFEKTYARQLSPSEYTLQPQLGFILLNQQLNPDDVLAVAYQYTYNGKVYQVGEFAQDLPTNADVPNVLFLKMLKSTSVRPKLPIWKLMMKNVYSLGAYQVNPSDFRLDVYYLDPAGGARRFIPAGNVNSIPLIRLLGLDRLNNNQDPQPDGVFDFIPGVTINPNNGKVIFPVLEPFGKDLNSKFTDQNVASKYVYQVLYDSTKTIALQFPEFDRYIIKGSYKGSSSTDISLGAFNIPQGSVKVTAGGQVLQENVDYTVDYNLGRLKIINQGIMNSGAPINVSFENNATFGFTTKTLFGTRADYYINDHLKLGGTYLHLSERPYTRKLNVGDDPISNAIYGLDGSWQTESGFITRLIDKLPLLDTKEKSTVTVSGEVARLDPGHSKAIGKGNAGQVYIDDFEGTQSTYDLKFPYSSWVLASTPSRSSTGLFPEADSINNLFYGYHRAKLSWYAIDPLFLRNISSTPEHIKNNPAEQCSFYTREINEKELFPNKQQVQGLPNNLPTFDLNFEPNVKGPYNFLAGPNSFNGVDSEGRIHLKNPEKNFGGIMRSIDYNDFEQANIEYIQFWVLDPYLNGYGGNRYGDIFIDLGNISEDVLKDSRLFMENGLPESSSSQANVDTTTWSIVPVNLPPTNSFSNNEAAREYQDVGYDGVGEKDGYEVAFDSVYLDSIAQNYGINSPYYNAALNDPAGDNYHYYLGGDYDSDQIGILDRYKKYNNPDGNSPISTSGQAISEAATNIPETEDLNRDNTLSETEEYFEYKVSLNPNDLISTGNNHITDIVTADVNCNDGNLLGQERWIQVKIPIEEYYKKIGGIQDFKSIRFIRVYLAGFDTTVNLRFAKLEFVRNQWRKYQFSLQTPGEYIPDDNNGETFFNVGSVSLEENSQRQPINYVMPPGIQREQQLGSVQTLLQNEQSLSVQACNLQDGDSRAVYKSLNLDLRTFKVLKMFVHAENAGTGYTFNYGDLTAFIRLGSDFISNYYEYEKALTPSLFNNNDTFNVWPASNNFEITLDQLTEIKSARNAAGASFSAPYSLVLSNGDRITIVGNPDLGLAKVAMLGIHNPKQGSGYPVGDADDGRAKCAELWFNELRLSGFDEEGGYAALGRVDVKLADLGNISVSGTMHSIGFGSLEQKLNERYKDNFFQYDASGTFQLGKFLPKSVGLQLPMYLGVTSSISNPKYDPYELDVLLKDKLNAITDAPARDSARKAAQDFVNIKSLNFTNVRRVNNSKTAKPHIYGIENWNATYAFTQTYKRSPIIESDITKKYHGEIGYIFPGKSKFISPFNKLIGTKPKYLKAVRDFNFNLLPTNISFRNVMDRQFGQTRMRETDALSPPADPTYNKFWTWDRFYGVKFELAKSLNLDFNAITNTRIDEDTGRIDTKPEKDSVWANIKNFGRTTHYHHTANLAYTLPINKIPILDWITGTVKYGAEYDWLALPLVSDTTDKGTAFEKIRLKENPLGNTLNNDQNINFNSDLNFRNLYNKWKFLKPYNTNTSALNQQKGETKDGKDNKDNTKDSKDQKKNNQPTAKGGLSFIIRPIISLKKVTFTYAQTRGTTLPGFIYKAKNFGQDLNKTSPGWDFVFGMQPDTNWLNDAAKKGWITSDTSMNYQFIQNYNRNITARAQFEPLKDVNVDINFLKNYSYNTTEFFKNTSLGYQHLNGRAFGTYSVSFIAWNTAFSKSDTNGNSPTFNLFEEYRQTVSQRLAKNNPEAVGPYYNPQDSTFNSNFANGYGPYSQDVLIPSFLAAYAGKDINSVGLYKYFNGIPAPNWRVTYNGLTKMKWAKKIWNSLNISHGYTSTLTINSFSSALDFKGNVKDGINLPSTIDSVSGNFISFYDIPSIGITEQFSPLIGVDAQWKNNVSTKFEYKKGRNLAMSFLDYQLVESRTSEVTVGLGYKWKNAPIPFKIQGKKKRLKNDLNLKCDVSVSNNITTNYKLDQAVSTPTQGMKTISISPSAEYMVSNRLNIRLFVDKRYSIPATSASYPIRYTNAGVTIRFTLAQ